MPKGYWTPLLVGKADSRPPKVEVDPVVLAARVDALEVKVAVIKTDVDAAKVGLAVAKTDIAGLKQPKP